jgi:hypothetical protein
VTSHPGGHAPPGLFHALGECGQGGDRFLERREAGLRRPRAVLAFITFLVLIQDCMPHFFNASFL